MKPRRLLEISDDPNRVCFNRALNQVFFLSGNVVNIFDRLENNDERLGEIYTRGSQLEIQCRLIVHGVSDQRVAARTELRQQLAGIVGICLLWLNTNNSVQQLWEERQRQRQLLRAGKFTLDVAHATPDVRRKFRVVAEEIGEVAQALSNIEECKSRHELKALEFDLFSEITQVAAVCVAWIESMEGVSK